MWVTTLILLPRVQLYKHIDEINVPKRFIDVGTCPFECCSYRRWTVKDTVAVLDKPEGKRIVEFLHKDDIVDGLTGEVISIPIPTNSIKDIPKTPIKAGDTFYVIHYQEVGYWKVWFRGKLIYVHEKFINARYPKSDWWVEIIDSHQNVGWTLSSRHFDHQDACE